MARSGASASSSAGSGRASPGVPVAPRGQNRGFKKQQPKIKTPRPDEEDDLPQRLAAIASKKTSVKAAMTLQGKSSAEIDFALKKIDEELKAKPKKKPDDEPPSDMDAGGGADEHPENEQSKILTLTPRKKGLPTLFGNMSERGLRVPPLAPEPNPRKKRDFKPSILAMTRAMQNARMPVANQSKGPAANGARGGFAASGGGRGGPSGGAGGPR